MARVQLARLDGLLERMRRNHARLSAQVGAPAWADAAACKRRRRRRRHRADRLRRGCRACMRRRRRARTRKACSQCESTRRTLSTCTSTRSGRRSWRAIDASGGTAPECPRTSSCSSARSTSTCRRSARSRTSDEIAFAFEKVAQAGHRVRLRIGVVGGRLVAQAMHLHFLAQMRDRFELAAVVDPECDGPDRTRSSVTTSRRRTRTIESCSTGRSSTRS